MKTNTTNIPAGYKNSPLGIIPIDWEVKRLGEICKNEGDYGINAPAVDYSENLPTYIRITDIDEDGHFDPTDRKSVDNANYREFILQKGDIVFARTGATVGKSYMYDEKDGELVFAGFLIRFSPEPEKAIPYFIKTYTETQDYQNWVKTTSMRSGQPGVNSKEYSSLQIPLPPLSEQRRIAEILTAWDEAIEKQSQKIKQLEQRKKGLMQQLLTGKKRLNGFTDKWKTVKLGEVGKMFSGGTPKTTENKYYNGSIPFIKSGEINLDRTQQYVSQLGIEKSSAKMVDKGDILYALYGATSGQCAISKMKGAINQAVLCIKTKENRYFIMSLLQENKELYYNKYLQGGQGNLSADIVKNYELLMPTLSEQTAIANILTSADEEIQNEKQKLENLKSQKKGLMQVLLTGKVRVKG